MKTLFAILLTTCLAFAQTINQTSSGSTNSNIIAPKGSLTITGQTTINGQTWQTTINGQTPAPTPARPPFAHGPHRPPSTPPPSDVQTWMAQAKANGGTNYQVHCVNTSCTARVGFADGSSLSGRGSTRQAAMAAINLKAAHPAPVAPPAPQVENYGGPL